MQLLWHWLFFLWSLRIENIMLSAKVAAVEAVLGAEDAEGVVDAEDAAVDHSASVS